MPGNENLDEELKEEHVRSWTNAAGENRMADAIFFAPGQVWFWTAVRVPRSVLRN